jgi:hypothetical protein
MSSSFFSSTCSKSAYNLSSWDAIMSLMFCGEAKEIPSNSENFFDI